MWRTADIQQQQQMDNLLDRLEERWEKRAKEKRGGVDKREKEWERKERAGNQTDRGYESKTIMGQHGRAPIYWTHHKSGHEKDRTKPRQKRPAG